MMQTKDWTLIKSYIGGKCPNAPKDHVMPFRLYDDDGELYFEGLMSEKMYNAGEDIFDPLDANMGDYGCTTMKVRSEGKTGYWEDV